MIRFPLFIDLKGADVILCGAGRMLGEKLEKLVPFGPNIRVFSADEFPEYPCVETDRRPFSAADIRENTAFVISAGNSPEESKRIYDICVSIKIPVNTVDTPELCTFYFPALICRENLAVGISTGGVSPAASACLRRHIEACLPDETDRILEWSASVRTDLRASIPSPAQRREIIRSAIDSAFRLGRPLSDAELEHLIDAAMRP